MKSSDNDKRIDMGSRPPECELGWYSLCIKSLIANAMFLLFSLPVITIPAARIALMRVVLELRHRVDCDLWKTFWKEFCCNLGGRTVIGLMLMLLPVSAGLYVYLFGSSAVSIAMFAVLFAFSLVVSGWWDMAESLVALSPLVNLKNAVFLAILCPKRSMLLLITVGLLDVLCFMLLPYSVAVLLVSHFVFTRWLVYRIVYGPISANLIQEKPGVEDVD